MEWRIATELARLASPTEVAGQQLAPPPYLRRHLADHAAAGHILNNRTLTDEFLPYLDLPRLRAATTQQTGVADRDLPMLPALRRAGHQWDFDQPHANSAAMQMWAAALGQLPPEPGNDVAWQAHWAHWPTGTGEILGRHGSIVSAVAALVLPDGRPVAVTGSYDATVRVWDLTTGAPIGDPLTGHTDAVARGGGAGAARRPPGRGHRQRRRHGAGVGPDTGTPIGDPLTGHTSWVVAVAALVLPDGRPVAVTGSDDHTVRVWDLTTGNPIGDPLTGHTDGVRAVAALVLPDGRPVAVTGSDDATVRVWDLRPPAPRSETPHRPHQLRWARWRRWCCRTAARSRSPAARTPRCGCGT